MIICGTGHRPKYCPCKYNNQHPWLKSVKADLTKALRDLNVNKVITGMAIGWDTWLAQVAIHMGLPLHAYVPFKGQEKAWPRESREEYQRILDISEKVIYVSESYTNDAFLKRDRAMVDDAEHVFSLLNPEVTEGGTYYTVKYAHTNGKPVTNFWK